MGLQQQFEKFEEDKARHKEIEAEIERELANAMMRGSKVSPSVDFEGSFSIPSTECEGPLPLCSSLSSKH